MFKSIMALFRGKANDQLESVVDQNAMTILRQQLRECTVGVGAARKAVAVAIAQNEREKEQYAKLVARISDLEKRAVAALEQDKGDLAREAAETISLLEAERDTSKETQDRFKTEITRLKKSVRESESRLRELQRGQRLANATDKTQKLRQSVPDSGVSTLDEAEQTLARLRDRQLEIDAISKAVDSMDQSTDPEKVAERLAEAGCGAPIRSSTEDVLERLSKKIKKPA